jgi:hypothetical protein
MIFTVVKIGMFWFKKEKVCKNCNLKYEVRNFYYQRVGTFCSRLCRTYYVEKLMKDGKLKSSSLGLSSPSCC